MLIHVNMYKSLDSLVALHCVLLLMIYIIKVKNDRPKEVKLKFGLENPSLEHKDLVSEVSVS